MIWHNIKNFVDYNYLKLCKIYVTLRSMMWATIWLTLCMINKTVLLTLCSVVDNALTWSFTACTLPIRSSMSASMTSFPQSYRSFSRLNSSMPANPPHTSISQVAPSRIRIVQRTTHLSTPRKWVAELVMLADIQQTVYPEKVTCQLHVMVQAR